MLISRKGHFLSVELQKLFLGKDLEKYAEPVQKMQFIIYGDIMRPSTILKEEQTWPIVEHFYEENRIQYADK